MTTQKDVRSAARDEKIARRALKTLKKTNKITGRKANKDARRVGRAKAGDARRSRRVVKNAEARNFRNYQKTLGAGGKTIDSVTGVQKTALSELGQTARSENLGKNVSAVAQARNPVAGTISAVRG